VIRRGLILIGAVLLPCAARAADGAVNIAQAFSTVCSAAIDDKPDLSSIAASVQMFIPNGMSGMVDKMMGRTSVRVFNAPAPNLTKYSIVVTSTTYSDAREINCFSTVAAPTPRAELESLAQSLKLEGGFYPTPGVTQGRWKRPGNQRIVLVSMLSTLATTVLTMQRIDFPAAAAEKN
jgi:hypothetical protein